MFRPFMGQIISVGFDFAPSGWMKCQGQLLPIDQYDALFNLLGTTYGGDGQNTFGLPDLQGRAALSMGQGPNLSNYVIADNGGDETVTLTSQQGPPHQHGVFVLPVPGTRNVPTDPKEGSHFLVNEGPAGASLVYTYAPYDAANQTALSSSSIGFTGGEPHENRQPLLAITYCIAVNGVFPSPN